MAAVTFDRVGKVFPDGTVAVEDLSMSIEDGEFMVFVGPSGCGKTTALRLVAGLEEISGGALMIDDTVVNDIDCADRDIAMVFQNYALYPHMSVYNNMRFPLRLSGITAADCDARIRRVARTLGLEPYLDRKPHTLSGGQRQRVAMGRALVREPRVFLMDEPLSNLDAKLRVQMRQEITRLQKSLGVTTIYVTHDQVEALTMGDRVAVLRRGRLQQVDDPQSLYDRPKNLFVAAFIGSPPMNLMQGVLESSDDRLVVRVGGNLLELDASERSVHQLSLADVGRQVVVGLRPERIDELTGGMTSRSLAAVVGGRESVGSDILIVAAIERAEPLSADIWNRAHDVDDPTEIEEIDGVEARVGLVGRLAPSTSARPGDLLRLTVHPGAIRLFDPQTGAAIGHPSG